MHLSNFTHWNQKTKDRLVLIRHKLGAKAETLNLHIKNKIIPTNLWNKNRLRKKYEYRKLNYSFRNLAYRYLISHMLPIKSIYLQNSCKCLQAKWFTTILTSSKRWCPHTLFTHKYLVLFAIIWFRISGVQIFS